MEHFEFQPKPDLSSTFRNSIGGFSNIPRFEVHNFNSTQAKEIVNESLFLDKVESGQLFIQNSMYGDGRKDKVQTLLIQQSILRQKELSLEVKENELNNREKLLIERERQLIDKQMKFQNTQHKIITHSFLNESTTKQNPQRIEKVEIKSKEIDQTLGKISNKNKTRNKKRKSILSLFGFKESSKVRKVENNYEKEAETSPEAQKVAMELLFMLNAKNSRFNASTKSFRK